MTTNQRSWVQVDDALERHGLLPDAEPRNEREHWLARQVCDPPPRLAYNKHNKRKGFRAKACRARGHDWSDPANLGIRKTGSRYCKACQREKRKARKSAA